MDRQLDSQEKLAWDSDLAVALLVGPDGKDLMLDLDTVTEAQRLALMDKFGLRYVGVLGIRNGVVDCAPADWNPETLRAVMSAVQPFAEYAAAKLAKIAKAEGDSASWLERLWTLQDARES
jgi:hypothetical protein